MKSPGVAGEGTSGRSPQLARTAGRPHLPAEPGAQVLKPLFLKQTPRCLGSALPPAVCGSLRTPAPTPALPNHRPTAAGTSSHVTRRRHRLFRRHSPGLRAARRPSSRKGRVSEGEDGSAGARGEHKRLRVRWSPVKGGLRRWWG